MMTPRARPEELPVQRMGKPRQRMPVRLFCSREGPRNGIPTQAGMNVNVIDNIAVVIVIHERVPIHRVIDRQCSDDDQQRNNHIAIVCGGEQACGWLLCEERLSARGRQLSDLITEQWAEA
jgi:hypothetical protein